VLAVVCVLLVAGGGAQSRQELELRRKALEQKIRHTHKILQETRANKDATLQQVLTLQRQIRQREALIAILHQELELLEWRMSRTVEVVNSLQSDLRLLKEEYARMLQLAWRQKLQHTPLLFLFSANNFNQLFLRWQYLRQYEVYRQRQAQLIESTRQTLAHKLQILETRRKEKQQLLRQAERQAQLLAYEVREHKALLANLQNDEVRLRQQLERQQRDREKLNRAIEALIREEMTRREAQLRRAAPSKAPSSKKAHSRSFAQLKKRLPWPAEGTVVRPFGKQPHPSLAHVIIENNGIDIRTQKGSQVRAVYSGKVVATSFVPGSGYLVLIAHGEWFTVYSNLDEVIVEKDQSVQTGDILGRVAINPTDDTSVLHFELWHGKQKQDPAQWLK